MSTLETRGLIRHSCLMCGGSCQGVQVPLINRAERDRITEQAMRLDVDTPIENDRLRQVDGRCAFLGDDNLCRIHAAWGPLAKPVVCQQYPLVAVRVGEVTRVGIDPGCFTSVSTWRNGPEVPAGTLVTNTSSYPDEALAFEAHVLAMLDAQQAIGPALSILTNTAEPWPEAFLKRWVIALQSIRLHELLDDSDTSPALRDSLGPVAQALRTWDGPPSAPKLSPEATDFALDATKRMVWLRLCSKLPSPAVVAVLSLAGAITCAWVHTDDEDFGRALAGWMRALRAPAVLSRLLPTPDSLRNLVEG